MLKAAIGGVVGNQDASNGAMFRHAAHLSPHQSAPITPALLNDDQSAQLLGVSVRRFHELRNEPWWSVKPVVLGPRLLRWPAAELVQAIAAMPRQEAKGSEPAQLRRAKIERMKAGGVAA